MSDNRDMYYVSVREPGHIGWEGKGRVWTDSAVCAIEVVLGYKLFQIAKVSDPTNFDASIQVVRFSQAGAKGERTTTYYKVI